MNNSKSTSKLQPFAWMNDAKNNTHASFYWLAPIPIDLPPTCPYVRDGLLSLRPCTMYGKNVQLATLVERLLTLVY